MAIRFVKRIGKQIRSSVITGILLIIPLFVTILIIIQLFQWIDSALPGILGVKMPPGIGILITLIIAYVAGVAAKNYFGKKFISLGNNIISNIPFLSKIYLTIQQIVDMVSVNKKQVFQRAVLVEFPRPGTYAIGFITSEANTVFSLKVSQKLLAVFIPTTPNPTSGFLLYVPEQEIIDANISVEAAVKLVVSGGLLGADNAATAAKQAASPASTGWKWTDIFSRTRTGKNLHDPRD
jgi:uncharacterized membrane protein